MQINPKYRNNPTFNKALSTYSEATSSKKSGGLGTITKSCSNRSTQGFQESISLEKRQSYRSFSIALKERAGEILYDPKKPINKQKCKN